MGTLYLDRRDARLRLDGRRLVIEEPDARPRGLPLALLERVVLQGQIHFDSGVLGALAERGASVVCLSARHSRRTAMLVGAGHGDARRRLGQYRLARVISQGPVDWHCEALLGCAEAGVPVVFLRWGLPRSGAASPERRSALQSNAGCTVCWRG